MNKKIYKSPETVCLHIEVSSLMQNTSQSPFAEAKQHGFPVEEEADDYADDNPWERIARPEDLWK